MTDTSELVCPIPPGVNDTWECEVTEVRQGKYSAGRDHSEFVVSDGVTTLRIPMDVAREFAHHALAKPASVLISIGDTGAWPNGQWEWHTGITFHQGAYAYSVRTMGKFPDCDPVDFLNEVKMLAEYAPRLLADKRARHTAEAV